MDDFQIRSLDELREKLAKMRWETGRLSAEQAFTVTDPRLRSHGLDGDCGVLALSISENISYSDAGRLLGSNVRGGRLQRVLEIFGYSSVAFLFSITLDELWNEGFFEVQRQAGRQAVICTKRVGGNSHVLAFKDGVLLGDYLPKDEFVVKVFLKKEGDLTRVRHRKRGLSMT